MRTLFSILFTFSLLLCISQVSDTLKHVRLTPEQMQEDFNYYRSLLEETHPGLYRYTSKEVMQSKLDSIATTFTTDRSFYDFYKTILALAADIRCAHSYAIPTSDISAFQSTIRSFPFYFYPINGKPIMLFNGTVDQIIKPGFELAEINGQPMEEVTEIFNRHMWSDGYVEVAKNQTLTGNAFRMFYYTLIGQPDSFDLTFKNLNDEKVSVTVPALSKAEFERNYAKNPVNAEVLKLYNQKSLKPRKLEFMDDVEGTARLVFTVFGGKGINDEDQAQMAMRKFMESAIKKMKKKDIEYLVIDIRDNPGGWDVQGIELLSYLLKSDKPFRYYIDALAVTDGTSEFLKYSDLPPNYEELAEEELIPQPDGTFQLNPKVNIGLRTQVPKKNRFKGKIYFLISERTASAASEFAALAKSRDLGVFVGQETNGAYEGGNGSTFIKLALPNSGIFVRTPLVSGTSDVIPVKPEGRGVMPDHEVNYTLEDLLVRHDRRLEFVKELIRKDQSLN